MQPARSISSYFGDEINNMRSVEDVEELRGLLPDDSWIAVVCGVSKEAWNTQDGEDDGLPDGFYVAPKDVYMPDLTAVADVLLGKLVSSIGLANPQVTTDCHFRDTGLSQNVWTLAHLSYMVRFLHFVSYKLFNNPSFSIASSLY